MCVIEWMCVNEWMRKGGRGGGGRKGKARQTGRNKDREYLHNSWFKALGGASVKQCGVINRARVRRSPMKSTHPFVLSPGLGVWLWKWSLRVAWEGSHVSTTEDSIPAGQALVERNLWLRELWHQPAGPWRMQPAHSQVPLLRRPALLSGSRHLQDTLAVTWLVEYGGCTFSKDPLPSVSGAVVIIKNFQGFPLPTLSPEQFVLLFYVFWVEGRRGYWI